MAKPFVLGQKVTISDAGYVYAFCDPAAEQFGLKGYNPGQGLMTPDGSTGTIAALPTYFSEADATLVGISLDIGYDVVIAEVGLSA